MNQQSDFLVWGNNQANLLSKSNSKCLSTPAPLSLPFQVASICASEKHLSFLTKEGSLYSYGSNLDGRLGVSTRSVDKAGFSEPIKVEIPSRVVKVESGFSHMIALTDKSELYSWGLGDYGALGTGEFKSRSTPTKVDLPTELVSQIRQISCGAMHSAFLFEDGTVYTCGSNEYGELGINRPEKVSTPIPITFHLPIHQVSCGVFYTLLLTKDGKVYGMGNNKYGQLATGHKVNECHPTLIRELNDIVKVTAGYHSGAIDKYGNLFIWGSGSFGELLRPKKFVLSVAIRDVAIRGFFGVAIGHTSKNQTRIYSWGNNTFGELGLGTFQASKQPQEVQSLRGLEISKIALGVNFAMVMLYPPMDNEEGEKSQSRIRKQVNRSPNLISDHKSVIGFEEKYLNSTRRFNEEASAKNKSKSKSKDAYPFEGIVNNRQQAVRNRTFARTDEAQMKSARGEISSYSHRYPLHKPEESYHFRSAAGPVQDLETGYHRDYQKQFLKLSSDYQALLTKYVNLEREIQTSQEHQYGGLRLIKEREHQLTEENLILKNQLSKLSYEMILLNDEIRILHRKNDEVSMGNDRNKHDQTRHSNPINPNINPASLGLSVEIEQEYNRLLTQKEQLISNLNQSITKNDQEYKLALAKASQENAGLRNQLNIEIHNNRKIIEEHQSLIDELEVEMKKSEKIYIALREENQALKSQKVCSQIKLAEIEASQIKANETSELNFKQKYETILKQNVIRDETLRNRITELEIQLNYEKEFNRKYQESIEQVKENSEKLQKQLHLQSDSNIERSSKIENMKAEIEKFKRYKKELDEKNIQLEDFTEKFQLFKKKSKEILDQKEGSIKDQSDYLDQKTKQFETTLAKKDAEIQEIFIQQTRVEKQLGKAKENISMLTNEVVVKTDEIAHLNQLKNNNEKKIQILSNEIQKQIDERETIVKELGEAKREVTRLKIVIGQTEAKLEFESEEKNKAIKTISMKDLQIESLKDEINKLNEKADNLKKQNNLYREENEEMRYQLETKAKINEELTKANRDFAEGEDQYNSRIQELQNRIYELEDQNKSYTPRYEALLIRNRELDERNRELGEMINKAIEIQAESYKKDILKEVELNTDHIINQCKEEQEFQFRARRNPKISKDIDPENVFVDEASLTKRGEKSSVIKQEPYTKMMKERISQHKKKVSESAQKLAGLLEMNEKGGKMMGRHSTEDYEKINSQMESFNQQKEQFMSKIHSFAEKLKII